MPTAWNRRLATLVLAAMAGTACGTSSVPAAPTRTELVTLTVLTHDSFNLSKALLDSLATDKLIRVEILRGGDAGAVLNQAILTKDNPVADVIFGIDNVSLSKAIDSGILTSNGRVVDDHADVDPDFLLDDTGLAVPVDHGDVCLNYDREAFGEDLAVPTTMNDLRDPAYASRLVVQDPSTSSPGLAFLLASIAAFGEHGWQDFWSDLRAGGVSIASGWEDAYYGQFSGGSGEGDRPLVVSYASSPPAEVVFGPDPDVDQAPTGVIAETCFRQVEFAGILAGTEQVAAATEFLAFLLSDDVQRDIPLQMFVFPVRPVTLPDVFVKHAEVIEDPFKLDPSTIDANRETWVQAWVDLMLR